MLVNSRLTRLVTRIAAGLTLAACVAAWPAPADAQPAGPQPPGRTRPFRGLFGGAPQDPSRAQTLTLTLNASTGYDDNVIADQSGVGNDPRNQVGSALVGGGGTLTYTKTARRLSFSANSMFDTRYYPEQSALSASSYGAGAGLSYQLSRRTRVSLNQNVAYQPSYQFGGLFPGFSNEPILGEGVPSNLDLAVSRRASWITNSNVMLDRELGRLSSVQVQYGYSQQKFTENPLDENGNPLTAGDLTSQQAGIRFRRRFTRYMSLRLGYEYIHGVYPFPVSTKVENHNIDVGLDYARTLSFSRKTSFSFATGSSIVQTSQLGRTYRVTGNAYLSHEFTPNWQGQLSYLRDVGFFGNFGTPIFSDSFSFRLRGVVASRMQVTLNTGYLSGQLGLMEGASSFHTFTGTASMIYALNQLMGLDVSYSYFDYNFAQNAALPPGVQPRFDRNSVRAGVTLWLPLIR
jgi:opacity protein-like surface antigen